MKKIKVVYVYSSAKLDTGSPRALLQLIDSLDRTRFSPAFVSVADGPLIDAMRERNVEIIRSEVTSLSWKNPIGLALAVREKRRLLNEIGAGVVHMNEPGWNSDIVIAARLANIPVALHLHNPCDITRRNVNFGMARRIFICSLAQSQVTTNFDRIRHKCTVLHNAIDVEVFARGRPVREAIGLAADDLVVGIVAQIRYGKGIDIFLDAAEQLLKESRNLKFVIVGPAAQDEGDFFARMMQRLKQARLKDHVINLGSRRDIPDLIASFDVFCLPTRAETFGIVVIEAMAAGVPVVASAVGGIPEIIIDQSIGCTVKNLTPDAFARALGEVLDAGPERKALGERGRLSIAGRFDLAHMGETLARVYGEMVTSDGY